jgi:hypothetical protein
MKSDLSSWRYNWATLSLEDLNTETWFSPCSAKITVAKSKVVTNGWFKKLAESSKEVHGNSRPVADLKMH